MLQLLSLFPNIEPQTTHPQQKDIVPFDTLSGDKSVQDYYTWYDKYEKTFQVFGKEKGNYYLMATDGVWNTQWHGS